MAKGKFTTPKIPVSFTKLGGGLNTTSGPLGLTNSESSDLQNIDFDRFGSILQRQGYTTLNGTAIANSPQGDGLMWWEYRENTTRTRKPVRVADGKIWKMDSLDGTWDEITLGTAGAWTAGVQTSYVSWNNKMYLTNNLNVPIEVVYDTGTPAIEKDTSAVPTNMNKAKFVVQFQSYLMYGNISLNPVPETRYDSRFYWSAIGDDTSWNAADFINVSKNDGQEITGMKVLGDRLVIYKTRSIYQAIFTGDRDIPFLVVKTNSPVGCIAPYSIQEIENGHVFYSHDGLYYFDGNNAYKLSDRITETLDGLTITSARSLYYRRKNRYILALTQSSNNDIAIVWDTSNNAFSLYKGINISDMAIFLVGGTDERPYFGDFSGFTYRMDIGNDDYPLGVQTLINSYYYTNWKNYDDIVDVKGIPHTYLYHQLSGATVDLSYSYDFEEGDENTLSIDITGGVAVYGSALFGEDVYSASGGNVQRQDIKGRGRVVRFKFSNNRISEEYQIDGIGTEAYAETNA